LKKSEARDRLLIEDFKSIQFSSNIKDGCHKTPIIHLCYQLRSATDIKRMAGTIDSYDCWDSCPGHKYLLG